MKAERRFPFRTRREISERRRTKIKLFVAETRRMFEEAVNEARKNNDS